MMSKDEFISQIKSLKVNEYAFCYAGDDDQNHVAMFGCKVLFGGECLLYDIDGQICVIQDTPLSTVDETLEEIYCEISYSFDGDIYLGVNHEDPNLD
jgi:hypothetical protein